jgi:hypothetical protein
VPEPTIATVTALDQNGEYEQSQIAVEELSELIVALKHYERGRGSRQAVQEELADVCVVLSALCHSFGRDKIEEIAEFKMNRLMQSLLLSSPPESPLQQRKASPAG